MNTELPNCLCSCSSGCIGKRNYVNVPQRNNCICCEVDCPAYESDRDDKLLDDWKVLDDESWDVISALRQKFCQQSRSEAKSPTVRDSPHSTCIHTNNKPLESRSLVERATDLIDYTPESEFLRKIKQQCQYLQNHLPNIFSALNDCFPEGEFSECQKCLLLRRKAHLSNGRSKCCSRQPDFSYEIPYRDKKMRMKHSSIFQRPCLEAERVYPPDNLKVDDKKSDHISRSKKRDGSRRFRKRKPNCSPKCQSENDFEPSLKKPNENSCERCWRFASPARSPVNKPDQRYDPNFRRAHSVISVRKGDGDGGGEGEGDGEEDQVGDYSEESGSPFSSEERNTLLNMDRGSPSSRSTRNKRGKSPVNASEPQIAPHICIKQKIDAAREMGRNGCAKHLYDTSPPRNEYASPHQKECSQHRANPPQIQHICPKHTNSLQQNETFKSQPKSRCPIHDCDFSEQKSSRQKSPPSSRSPQEGISQQMSPQLRTSGNSKQPCQELSRKLLSACPKAISQGTQSFGQEPKSRSPCGVEDLDLTEYKDICINQKRTSYSPRPDPCSMYENKKKFPPCGAFIPKTPKPCDRPKMETIPEVPPKNRGDSGSKRDGSGRGRDSSGAGRDGSGRGRDSSGAGRDGSGRGRDSSGAGRDGSGRGRDSSGAGRDGSGRGRDSSGAGRDGSGRGRPETLSSNFEDITGLDSQTSKLSKHLKDSKDLLKKNTSNKAAEKSDTAKKGKGDKSPARADSKKGGKKYGKSGGKSGGKPAGKKSPDRGKSATRGGGRDGGRGSGSGNKNVTIGGASRCGAKKPSQFDKAHPLRPCKCPPRIPEPDQPSGSYRNQGQTLCCHCDWEEENNQFPAYSQAGGSQVCNCTTPRPRTPSPEPTSPILRIDAMECPYRAYFNKFGPEGAPRNCRSQQQDNRQTSRESQSEISTQELLQCTPRKYFMFYMTQERDKKDNDVEVLVEELAQGCPKNEAASRTKDIREKMKKINEPPPDSMALRFQKGVSEACKVPQNSRVLYF